MTYNNSLFKKLEELDKIIEDVKVDIEFNDEDACEFSDSIKLYSEYFNDENTDFDSGASKFCIIPKDENYVIKVPFDYLWIEGDYAEGQESEYAPLIDYCDLEQQNYIEAKTEYAGAEKFLAETKCLYSGKNKFYVQEKATGYWTRYNDNGSLQSLLNSTDSARLKSAINSGACSNIPAHWLEDLVEYGLMYDAMEDVNSFLDFLDDSRIGDLCGRNIGYIGDKPVLFDYSSWYGPNGSGWVAY